MNEQLLYQLLKIIKHNGNIWDIIDDGYEFGQISYFLEHLKSDNYIKTTDEGKTLITEIADTYIKKFEANNSIKKYSKWILPQKEMWHAPLSRSYIYIPKG